MAAAAPTRTQFDPELVSEMFLNVQGHSSLAKLNGGSPLSFVGNKEFVFTFDKDVDIVAENGAKGVGGVKIEPVTMVPIKFEYGARISNEFMYCAEEEQVEILKNFAEGFARKLAAGLDKAAMHGVNPRTGSASTVVGTNNFDSKVTNTVTYAAATADANIDAAIALVEGADRECTGIAISPTMRTALAAMKSTAGDRLYPEFAFGGKPATLGDQVLDVNGTVSAGAVDEAIVGDFANAFKWGYAKDVMLEVIEYGNPDNDTTAGDLKGHNQVYLRAEAFIGWAILDGASFARVTD